jgi:hypothetical protein
MNDKDKEAFRLWAGEEEGESLLYDGAAFHTWQAACEYKDKEIMNEVRQTPSGVSVVKFNKELVRKEIEKLQAENKKLREALLEIKDYGYATCSSDGEQIYNIAEEALKEVDENK